MLRGTGAIAGRVGVVGALALALGACGPASGPAPSSDVTLAASAPTYTGSAACASCHADIDTRWSTSHHAKALAAASADTVLAAFDGVWRGEGAQRFRPVREGDAFLFETPSGDTVKRLTVRWTIGVTPLQQYLVERDGGRWQAFTWVWDARAAAAGGQRWYFLYADQPPAVVEANHWDSARQNANHQCVACHAVDFEKGVDAESGVLASRMTEPGVGCESCHGPGGAHIAWANAPEGSRGNAPAWSRLGGDRIAALVRPEGLALAVPANEDGLAHAARVGQVCGDCHARRTPLTAGEIGAMPHFQLARVADGLYFADGRMRDEVFNLGSFQQSRMHDAGVACTHCHEPHGGGLRAPGNAVCADCHEPAVFDAVAHMGHAPGTPGGRCVDCHMPTTTFMGIDARHDHAFQRPDPREAERVGSPTPCGTCHEDRPAEWMASAIEAWRREGARPRREFADRLHAAWTWQVDGAGAVTSLAGDPAQAAIVRASALDALANLGGGASPALLNTAARDRDAGVRSAVARLVATPEAGATVLLERLLGDADRGVRIAALQAGLDAGRPFDASPLGRRLQSVADEWRPMLEADSDRAAACVSLGRLALAEGDLPTARLWFDRARARDPVDTAAAVAWAEFAWRSGEASAPLQVLEALVVDRPDDARAWHALGLMRIRAGQRDAALPALARAVEQAPDEPRFIYVLAVAEYDLGDRDAGRRRMSALAAERPGYGPALETAQSWATNSSGPAASRPSAAASSPTPQTPPTDTGVLP